MSPALQALSDQFAALKAVDTSVLAYVKGIAAQIAAGADDAAAMTQLAADVHAQVDAMTAALPATPAPTPDPAPAPAPAAS